MENPFVNVLNVCDVARILETLETYDIKSEILEDAEDFIMEFKMALEHFNHPLKDTAAGDFSPGLLFDKHLDELLRSTQNLYGILSDEGKARVREKLLESQKETAENAHTKKIGEAFQTTGFNLLERHSDSQHAGTASPTA